MQRLIDADKVVERMSAAFRTQMEVCDEDTRRTLKLFIDFLEEVIPEQPMVDAVEVVRCKDCKFWHTPSCATYRILYDMENEREDEWMIDDAEGFCSYGERKE